MGSPRAPLSFERPFAIRSIFHAFFLRTHAATPRPPVCARPTDPLFFLKCVQLITRREPYKGMQPLQVIAAVVFQGKRLPQPQKTDPRYAQFCWPCALHPYILGSGCRTAAQQLNLAATSSLHSAYLCRTAAQLVRVDRQVLGGKCGPSPALRDDPRDSARPIRRVSATGTAPAEGVNDCHRQSVMAAKLVPLGGSNSRRLRSSHSRPTGRSRSPNKCALLFVI